MIDNIQLLNTNFFVILGCYVMFSTIRLKALVEKNNQFGLAII